MGISGFTNYIRLQIPELTITMTARAIRSIVKAVEQVEGNGVTIRRSIGSRTSKMFNPFLIFDHFTVKANSGFPEHPHKGQETITLLLKGALAHEDFTGSRGVLYPGDLQFMTAGRGIVHSEMPVPFKGEPAMGIQIWVDLPEHLKEVKPRYRDLREWEIPEATDQNGDLKVRVISGKAYGVESKLDLTYTPTEYYLYNLKAGAKFEQQLNPKFNYFLYVLEGSTLKIGEKEVTQYDNSFFDEEGDYVEGKNIGDDAIQFVLVGGPKLNQKILHYGPFIGTTNRYLEEAIADYSNSTAGFAQRKNWKTLISNGITDEMINGPLNGSLKERERQRKAYIAKDSQ